MRSIALLHEAHFLLQQISKQLEIVLNGILSEWV